MNSFAAKFASPECPRCKKPITVGQMIKARISKPWVHDSCPEVVSATDAMELAELASGLYERGFRLYDTIWRHLDDDDNNRIAVYYSIDLASEVRINVFSPRCDFLYAKVAESALRLVDLLLESAAATDTSDDEFEAYRQHLIARISP